MTQAQALTILKTGASVFLTGEPGSGKTFVINAYVNYLRQNGIEPSITASTGIAATHIGGVTIHSWCGIGIRQTLSKYDLDKISSTEYIVKRVRKTKVLIIDEISMLPHETLTMVDAVCREIKNNNEPFGGIQTVFVGDFFQLPPIVKRVNQGNEQEFFIEEEPGSVFACNAPVWKNMNQITCYLTEQYRQDDPQFLSILSSIRSGTFDEEHIKHLESRKTKYALAPENIPKLFSRNINVDRVNDEMLEKITQKLQVFSMQSKGHDLLVASIKKGCLSPETLNLKIGASVMFTKNNPKEGWVNGTLGTIEGFDIKTGNPIVKTKDKRITVEKMDWSIEENGKVKATISQVPLRLAWAITVHKSQGMSLDEAVMDLSDVFEYGQGYVALSRVRRLSGIHILGWNERVFEVHPEILIKDKLFRVASEEAEKTFAKIPAEEIEKMHNDFITASGGVRGKKIKGKKEPEMDTYSETLLLWREGKNISEITKERKIKEATVFSHLEKLINDGKISYAEVNKIISPALAMSLPKIFSTFKKLDTEKLSPVFEELGGEYSYNDLRLARMAMKAK